MQLEFVVAAYIFIAPCLLYWVFVREQWFDIGQRELLSKLELVPVTSELERLGPKLHARF